MHGWPSILKKRKMNQKKNCLQSAHKVFWNVCIWLVVGDLIFCGMWTNLLVRSQNGLFQDSDFAGDLEDSRSTSGGVLCIFRKSHVCANQLDVQETDFSFTQFYRSWNHFSRCRFTHGRYSRSRSLGYGEWSISFRTEQNRWTQERAAGKPSAIVKWNMHNTIPIKDTNVLPKNIDHIPSNTMNSDSSAMLYVFEDNEAVIKMIIKGRSPTVRHVSRTHRVALDWLFDRINLDPQIQIRYIDTKHQVPDMLTEGNFTRDEWNNLLHLLNISHFSSTCCTKNFSLISCSTMAKRIPNQKEEERVVCKSRPAVLDMSSYFIATSSSAASSPIASKSPGMPMASGRPDSRMSVEPSSFDAASTSKKKKIQKTQTTLRLEPGTAKENLLPKTIELGRNPLHTEPVLQLTRKVKSIWKRHGTTISVYRWTHCITWKPSSSMVRKIYGTQPGDPMEYLNVNIWLFGECSWIHSSSSSSSRKKLREEP